MKKLAIFASGNGSNYEAIEKAILNGTIQNACVSLVVVDNQDAFVIERAKKYNRTTFIFNPKDYPNKEAYEKEIENLLFKLDINLVCLAGYMRIIGKTLLDKYEGKIINIHPSLLPSFKGAHAIKDAFMYGVKVFGVTIHYVSSELDSGKIISQASFSYYGHKLDEVEKKIHEIEHELYPKTINYLLGEKDNESFN